MRKILFLTVLSLVLLTGCGEKKEEKEPCNSITGGSFNIIFETNDANPIQNMNVCIACAPDTYQDLPVLDSNTAIFEGWYYDKELTKKVSAKNSVDIKPVPKYDKNDKTCIVGYENITLYAKWDTEALVD